MVDSLLGARLEARRRVDPALRQVRVRRHRRPRPGSRVNLSATSVAERFVLRGYSQYRAFPLHIPVLALDHTKVLDPRRDALSDIQPLLLMVRFGKLHVRPSRSAA